MDCVGRVTLLNLGLGPGPMYFQKYNMLPRGTVACTATHCMHHRKGDGPTESLHDSFATPSIAIEGVAKFSIDYVRKIRQPPQIDAELRVECMELPRILAKLLYIHTTSSRAWYALKIDWMWRRLSAT